jgi:PAS domain-containing protein
MQRIHHSLFELAPDAMITSDERGSILEVNAELERQFGYRREESIGEKVERLVPQRLGNALFAIPRDLSGLLFPAERAGFGHYRATQECRIICFEGRLLAI